MIKWNRRSFVKNTAFTAAGLSLFSACMEAAKKTPDNARFKISLAEWSLHRTIESGQMTNLDFAKKAAETFGIFAIEYVNSFFKDKAKNSAYLSDLNIRAADHGVKQLLIMIDGEGGLAEVNETRRAEAVDNHYKWIDAAKALGCRSVRVNTFSETPDRDRMHEAAIKSLSALATYGKTMDINVIVENHGGFSSDGSWLSSVMKNVNMDNCGTLPDFGNFCIRREDGAQWSKPCVEEYDRYKGIEEMLPYAKGVSAKSYDFDASGFETTIAYDRMLEIIKKSNYSGYIGVEYEGNRLSEEAGILATKKLLERLIA